MVAANVDLIRAIETDGFAVIADVLDREEALGMRPVLEQAIDEDLTMLADKPGYHDHWMVHNLMLRGEPFVRLLENETIHKYLSAILSETCILYAYTSSSLPPSGANFSARIHVDSPRVIPGYVTNVGVMIALDDYTLDNGPTMFLPRSHTITEPPSEHVFERDAVKVFPKAGEAVIFNARCWHRGGRNTTDTPRHAVTMNVCRSYMRQRFDYPRLMSSKLIESLSPIGRRFIGMNVRVPTSLDEYYVPESERLYLAGQG